MVELVLAEDEAPEVEGGDACEGLEQCYKTFWTVLSKV